MFVLDGKIKMKNLLIEKIFGNFEMGGGQVNYIVRTDKMRIQQVLLNLLSNAIKFSHRLGHIIVRVT